MLGDIFHAYYFNLHFQTNNYFLLICHHGEFFRMMINIFEKLIFQYFSKLSERFYDEETTTRDPDFVKLSRTLDRVYNATSDGTLKTLKGTLPPHYFHYDTVSFPTSSVFNYYFLFFLLKNPKNLLCKIKGGTDGKIRFFKLFLGYTFKKCALMLKTGVP